MTLSSSLYNISSSLLAVLESGMQVDEETGEIIADVSDLAKLQMKLEDKLDGTVSWLRKMQAEVDYIKAEEKRFSERRKSLEKALDSYEGYVLDNVKKLPSERLKTPLNTISVHHSSRVDVLDDESIPERLMRVKTEKAPDKKAIKTELMAGNDVPGCALVVTESLQIK